MSPKLPFNRIISTAAVIGLLTVTLRGTGASDPLVDLGQVISLGGESMDTDESDEQSDADSQSQVQATAQNPSSSDETASIVVLGTTITYNGYEKTEDALYAYIDSAARRGEHIEIDNRYADYRLYSRIAEYLADNDIRDVKIIGE